MEILIKTFDELSIKELYTLLQLRSEVFVVEQNCVYQDIDGKDKKALHILGFENNELVAYTRCFRQGDYFDMASIGRVIVKENYRCHGYGNLIMKTSISEIEQRFHTSEIKLSAQQYLINFYECLGFRAIGEGYMEDGIPHITMIKN